MTSRRSKHAFLLRGYARSPITDIRVRDGVFDGVESADVLEAVRHLVLTNVRVNGELRRSPLPLG